ncbi:MAG: hypothetical protein WC331_10800 [Candidatus Omnitrophota bacterium]
MTKDCTFQELYTAEAKRTTPTKPIRLPKKTREIRFRVNHHHRTPRKVPRAIAGR